jgi:hypothetical protein
LDTPEHVDSGNMKGDGKIRLRLFKPGFLKLIGHQIVFCLDLQDRENVFEPFEVQTGPFYTGKMQFLNEGKTADFTPKLAVLKKIRENGGSLFT